MATDEAALLAEANRINYRLRSTFFYRKLKEYGTIGFPALVANLYPVEHLYDWSDRAQWQIGNDAFGYVASHPALHLIQVFCHPRLLREHPRLLAYYRHIAALPQKGVEHLVGMDINKYEMDSDTKYPLDSAQALALASLFNEHISLIIDSSIQSMTGEELHGVLLTSTGTQIDGSWRNAIGKEAEKVVQRLLANEARERNLLAALIPRAGPPVEQFDQANPQAQVSQIERYRGLMLTNGTSMLFPSDPDVSLLNPQGVTVCAIEVKGGADAAGALERYGAAKKTFEEARRVTPGVITILVASCITAEVRARITSDPTISSFYNLTEMLTEGSPSNASFMREAFGLLGISS